jgi:two-component sensor histidine kinase
MKFINLILNFGVRHIHEHDEKIVIRKINIIFIVGYFLIFISFLIQNYFGIVEYNYVYYGILIAGWLVPVLIYMGKILMSVYAYFIIAFSFFSVLTLMMGVDSNVIYFLIIMIFSLNNILSNKKYLHHLKWFYIILIIVLVVVYYLLIYHENFLYYSLDSDRFQFLKHYNIIVFFITAISFGGFLTYESYVNDVVTKKILREKEVLLSEVYHRVKNNLNIINSLFNMKKNSSDNTEIKDLMDEFRQRIFSISTLYEKLINKENYEINIKDYLNEIIKEFLTIHNHENKIKIHSIIDSISVNLNKSMPLGLIINEFLTNSIKHNISKNNNIEIKLKLEVNEKFNELKVHYSDNSNGKLKIPESKFITEEKSFGIQIILMLIEQLNGIFFIKNEDKIDIEIIIPLNDN